MTKKNKIICLLFMAILAIVSLSWGYLSKEGQTFTEPNNMLAVFLGEEKSKTFPTKDGGYVYDHTECTNDEEATWNADTWKLTVSKITKGTKCNVYFTLGFTEKEFAYTGSVEEFIVPVSGNYKLEVWGAQGGNGSLNKVSTQTEAKGGKGGYSQGTVNLTKGTNLYIYVGGQGQSVTSGGAGFNGGGSVVNCGNSMQHGGGGGATDIRIGEDSLYHRVIVAGGGGGAPGLNDGTPDGNVNGGSGGGIEGVSPGPSYTSAHSSGYREGGHGGTLTAGGLGGQSDSTGNPGSFGQGGNWTENGNNSYGSGAGGGGWYGGGSGASGGTAGGGGSGWIYTEEAFNTWNSGNSTDAANWKLDTKYYLTDASTIAGNESMPTHDGLGTMIGNSENGFAKITLVR